LGKSAIDNPVQGNMEHPIVSAMGFVKSTQENGGASMDVNTNKVYGYGEGKGIAIGGESADSGKTIPTKYLGRAFKNPISKLDIQDVFAAKTAARKAIGHGRRENLLVGSWNPSPEEVAASAATGKNISGINMDVSRIYSHADAPKIFKARPEEAAGTNMEDFSTVKNPYHKPKK